MKISELTVENVKEYCGISSENNLIKIFMDAAKARIMSGTGLTEAEIDKYEDLTVAYLCLVNDMDSERDYATDKDTVNPAVEHILSMHRRNLL